MLALCADTTSSSSAGTAQELICADSWSRSGCRIAFAEVTAPSATTI
jgi:hypothetical protein